jgi:4-hydroxy-2-oxoheptanedioate aldolase
MKALKVVRENAIKRGIAEGRKVPGFQMAFYAPVLIEILGSLDFEFVYLDCEHGTFSLEQIENCCRAAEVSGLTVICRIPHVEDALGCLDRGVQGFIFPHVTCGDDIRKIQEACFFYPRGQRSNGGGRGDRYWRPVQDFHEHFAEANRNISIAVQIEDKAAMDNIDDILSVEGVVDFYVIGFNDLAQSMGIPRRKGPREPALVEAGDLLTRKIHEKGGLLKEDALNLIYMRDFLLKVGQQYLDSAKA